MFELVVFIVVAFVAFEVGQQVGHRNAQRILKAQGQKKPHARWL